MKKKTIGFFNIEFPSEKPFTESKTIRGGGAGKSLLDLIVHLNPKKYNIIIFSVGTKNKTQIEYVRQNLKLIRYPVIGRKLVEFLPINQNFIAPAFMCKPLEKKLDLIHCQLGYHGAEIPAMLYKYIYNVPLVLSLRGVINPSWANPFFKLFLTLYKKTNYRQIIKMADKIVIPSKSIFSKIKALSMASKTQEKVEIIPNGVNFQAFSKYYPQKHKHGKRTIPILDFSIERNNIIFLYVGSLSKRKGVHILFKAFKSFTKEFNNAILILVGNGPLFSSISKETQRKKLEERVLLTGYIKNKEVMAQIYAVSDLLILPSIGEGFSRVILESMAAGTPCLVSDTPANVEAIAEGTLGFIAERNPINIKEKMKEFMEIDQKSKSEMSKKCHQYAKTFDWKKNSIRMENIYDNLLS